MLVKFKSKIIVFVVAILVIVTTFLVLTASRFDYFEKPAYRRPGAYGFESGYDTDNNGYAKDGSEVERLTSVVPNQRQLDFLELEYYNFAHFGMNTMTGDEWGTGKESPSLFNPAKLDTDQWCEAALASGSKGIILTAKHHDGFCLWPSAVTEHSVKNSPYKDGKGDVVAELAASCEKYGLKLGLYLSPWDMNAPSYGKNEYNDFFVAQLTELCTNYGEIFCFWFDGARGEADIDDDFEYDFQRWFEVIEELQPNAVTSVTGRDVRWVGNEGGISRESEWSVVVDYEQKHQKNPDDAKRLQNVNSSTEDLGSREALKDFSDDLLIFKPAEVDVSIRTGWFYHEKQSPKTLKQLLHIYYTSVGGNSSLLLNLTPDKNGLIPEKDVARLKEFGDEIKASTEKPITPAYASAGKYANGKVEMFANDTLSNVFDDNRDTSFELQDGNYIVDFHFSTITDFSRIDLREDLRFSQRVELFELWAKDGDDWKLIADNTVIGNRKIFMFRKPVQTDCIRLVVKQSRGNPILRNVSFYG